MNYEQYERLYSSSKNLNLNSLKSSINNNFSNTNELLRQIEDEITSVQGTQDESSIPIQELLCSVQNFVNACNTIDSGVSQMSAEIANLDNLLFKMGSSVENCVIHVSTETYANAGDYLLVKSLRRLIETQNENINWIRLDVKSPVTASTVESINKGTALIIGGGGLFLRERTPNYFSGWQWPISKELIEQINVPIYVLGVGYNRFRNQEDFVPCFYENVTALVQKSAFFGLRNHGSINAIRKFLPDSLKSKVTYFPCATTVISKLFDIELYKTEKPIIAINCAFDRGRLRFGEQKDYILHSIAKAAKSLSNDYEILCYLHCAQDVEMCSYMDEHNVSYGIVKLFESKNELDMIEAYSLPSLVIGMRGHSQMVAFGCVTPALSIISHDKIKWFLDDIEHPEWGLDVNEDCFEKKIIEKAEYMLSHSSDIRKKIIEAQESIWSLLQTTVSEIII